MTAETETIVRLKIRSCSQTAGTITQTLRIEPDRAWSIGDLRPHTTIAEPDHGWVRHSGLPRNATLAEHIEELLKTLRPASESIKKLSSTEYVEVSVVIYAASCPTLHIEPLLLQQMSDLGAALDIDLYIADDEQ